MALASRHSQMAQSAKDKENDRLVDEIASATGQSKAAVRRQAVCELHERLRLEGRMIPGGTWLLMPARPRRPWF